MNKIVNQDQFLKVINSDLSQVSNKDLISNIKFYKTFLNQGVLYMDYFDKLNNELESRVLKTCFQNDTDLS